MIDWEAFRPALVSWLVAGTGLDSKLIFFENDQRGFSGKKFLVVKVNRVGNTPGFTDEVSQGLNLDTENYDQIVRGVRTIIVTVECWTISQAATGIADNVLEKLRTLSRVDRVKEPLDNARVALSSLGDSIQSDVEVDKRLWSVWSMECDFNYSFEYTDETETNAGIIEAVSGNYQVPDTADEKPFLVDTRE